MDSIDTSRRTRLVIYVLAAVFAIASLVLALTSGSSGGPLWTRLGGDDADRSGEASVAVGPEGTLRSGAGDDSPDADAGEGSEQHEGTPGSSGTGDSGDDSDAGEPGDDLSRTAVAQIEIPGYMVPQTYEARVAVLGWQNRQAGMVYLEVSDARLMGPIDPASGEEMAPPPAGERDQSPRFEGIVLLATTAERTRTELVKGGDTQIRLVLLPISGGAATFTVADVR